MKISKWVCVIFVLVFMVPVITGCSHENLVEYPYFEVVDNDELGCVELIHEGITYRPFGSFGGDSKYRGNQIGIREDNEDSKICEIKGYNSSEWIVDYHDVIMGGDMIFKAIDVTDIPLELAKFKDYNY